MQTIMIINEKNFLYSLGQLRKKAFAFLEFEMKKAGITDVPPSCGDVLYAVARKEDVTISDLCQMTKKDKSTISIAINTLEKSGYVIKKKDRTDGRSVRITLSEKAKGCADRMMEISGLLGDQFFTGMSNEEKTIFFLLINKISANF